MPRNLFVRDYVLLGLRLDRLAPGTVDTYIGDEALRRHVDADPMPRPTELLRTVRRLRAELPDAGLAWHRTRYLAAQLVALDCRARILAGDPVGFVEEVEACVDVRIRLGDEDGYREAHRCLDAVLPGRGGLAERLAAHRTADQVVPTRLMAAVGALSAALRERTAVHYTLPTGEGVGYEFVGDRPWSALNNYRRGYRSTVSINIDARPRAEQLAQLVAREAYPGTTSSSAARSGVSCGTPGRPNTRSLCWVRRTR